MKKIISLLIVAVMVFALATSAAAYSFNAETGRLTGSYDGEGNIETWVDGAFAGGKTLDVKVADGTHTIDVFVNGVKVATESVLVCTNHDFQVESETPATCTAEGERVSVCSICGEKKTEALPKIDHVIVEDPAVEAQVGVPGKTAGSHCEVCGTVIVAQEEIPAIEIIPNTYAIDLENTTVADTTSGTGAVIVTGNEEVPALYARVTWVYEMNNGDSFAYCAMKDVTSSDAGLIFKMVGPQAPYSAELKGVQVALVTDPDADTSGAYDPLATAKK